MPNTLYTITAELHEIIQEKAQKYGVEIDVTNDKYWVVIDLSKDPVICSKDWINENLGFGEGEIIAIQAPQIRQILLAFREILEKDGNIYTCRDNQRIWIGNQVSETLCKVWLDGLTSFFDTQPETVLSELLEVLKDL